MKIKQFIKAVNEYANNNTPIIMNGEKLTKTQINTLCYKYDIAY